MQTERRIDPDPFTISLAILSGVSAVLTIVQFVENHLPPKLPSKQRTRLRELMGGLEEQTRGLSQDLDAVRSIFRTAEWPDGPRMRLCTGALIPAREFDRYMSVTDGIYKRLRVINKICGDVERGLLQQVTMDRRTPVNRLGEARERFERLLQQKNLSVEEGWQELEALLASISAAISAIRSELDS